MAKKEVNHFGELEITTDAPFANLPMPKRVNEANKGPTTPIGQQPKKLKKLK